MSRGGRRRRPPASPWAPPRAGAASCEGGRRARRRASGLQAPARKRPVAVERASAAEICGGVGAPEAPHTEAAVEPGGDDEAVAGVALCEGDARLVRGAPCGRDHRRKSTSTLIGSSSHVRRSPRLRAFCQRKPRPALGAPTSVCFLGPASAQSEDLRPKFLAAAAAAASEDDGSSRTNVPLRGESGRRITSGDMRAAARRGRRAQTRDTVAARVRFPRTCGCRTAD